MTLEQALMYVPGVPATPTGFAHYTGVEACLSILENEEFWLRHVRFQSDVTEVRWGLNCIAKARQQGVLSSLTMHLDRYSPGSGAQLWKLLMPSSIHFDLGTYIACITEHPADEIDTGRESMWQRDVHNVRVAIVLNEQTLSTSSFRGTIFRQVAYADPETVVVHIADCVERIRALAPEVGKDPAVAADIAFRMLRDVALCTKQPTAQYIGEREWRIIVSSTVLETRGLCFREVRLRNCMERVCVMPIATAAPKLTSESWIKEILVGPAQKEHSRIVVKDRLIAALQQKGYDKADERVRLARTR